MNNISLQWLLPEQDQQEVDKVRWQVVEENNREDMCEVAALNGSIRIPQGVRERVLVELLLALFDTLSPGQGIFRGSSYVRVEDLRGSTTDQIN